MLWRRKGSPCVLYACVAKSCKSKTRCISLTAVDVLTNDALVNLLVDPDGPISCWLTHLTGITKKDLHRAWRQRAVLTGFKGARDKLFEHIDSRTILVGHALVNDLRVLRMHMTVLTVLDDAPH